MESDTGGSTEMKNRNQRVKEELTANLMWKTNMQRKNTGGVLLGKLITERNLNRMIVCQMIRKGWNIEKETDLEITEVDRNAFSFEFRRKENYQRILNGRPWSIQGILLSIQQWQEYATYKEIEFHLCPFWIQFHDLPIGGMYEENAIALGSMIGEMVKVENPRRNDMLIRSFLRARVIVDIRKPLVTGMWCPRPQRDPIWIKARYERLQNFCYECGRIGHDQRNCPYEEQEEAEGEKKYGGWLSTQAARPTEGTSRKYKERWEEEAEERKARTEYGWRQNKQQEETVEITYTARKSWYADKKNKEDKKNEDGEEQERIKATKEGSEPKKEKMEGKERRERREETQGTRADEMKGEKLPEAKEDLSKAIVVYGAQTPMEEVLRGIKKIKLKREREEEEEGEVAKKRRIETEKKEGEMEPVNTNNQRKIRRKYVSVKRTLGRGDNRKRSDKGKAIMTYRKEDLNATEECKEILNYQHIKETGRGEYMGVEAEGSGGWPTTATKEK